MEVVIHQDTRAVAVAVADAVAATVQSKPDAVLGLATGATFIDAYTELIERHRQGLSFARTTMFLLDEYMGLDPAHPQRYANVIRTVFTTAIDVDDDNVHSPNPDAADLRAECLRYEESIAANGRIDLQLLGIGRDGHLAFNEPGSSLASRTRLKTLAQPTRNDNAQFFASPHDVPTLALTQGIGTILEAARLVTAATGSHKAAVVAGAVEGPVAASLPASALQLHPDVELHIDTAAAAYLALTDYYCEAASLQETLASIGATTSRRGVQT